MTRIGVVGAGAGAAAAAFAVERALPDAEVTILEKSGGVCGRAATRRRGDVTYDYGANYVKSADGRVAELLTETLDAEGIVDVTEPIYVFDRAGAVSEGRDLDEHKWTYRAGIGQLGERLLGRTDATVHRRTRVASVVRDGGRWRLGDADGNEWGPFEYLVVNPPAPRTAALLDDADWESERRDALVEAARAVDYRSVWTAVLHYPFELDRPYYALVNTDKEHAVGWIAREECKPGHVPEGESLLIVQANHDWSVERADDPPAENVRDLAGHAADVMDDERLAAPDWTDHRAWRYALAEGGADREPVAAAEADGLYCVGDWVAGEARVHAALRNGLDAGARLADAVED